MKPVPAQLLMSFLGAVEGASLEAQVARMQRQVEGLNADQLRRLYRQQKRDGVDLHVSRVIEDAMIAAVRAAPVEGEDMPNEHGVILRIAPDWSFHAAAIGFEAFTARTRWGYVASVIFTWLGRPLGISSVSITFDSFRTAGMAVAATLDDFAADIRARTNSGLDKEYLVVCATAIGVLAERAYMLRMGIWPQSKAKRRKAQKKAIPATPRRKQPSGPKRKTRAKTGPISTRRTVPKRGSMAEARDG